MNMISIKKEDIIVASLTIPFIVNVPISYLHIAGVATYLRSTNYFAILNIMSIALLVIPGLFEFMRTRKITLEMTFEKVLLCILFLVPLSGVIGIVGGSSFVRILIDMGTLAILPVAYFLSVTLYYPGISEKIIKKIYYILLGLGCFEVVIQFYLVLINGISPRSGSPFFIFLLPCLFLKKNKRVIDYFLILLFTSSIFLSNKRTIWIAGILTYFCIFFFLRIQKEILRKTLISLVFSVSIIVVILAIFPHQRNYAVKRFGDIFFSLRGNQQYTDGSVALRLAEKDAIVHSFFPYNPIQIFFGFGSGAQWKVGESGIPALYYDYNSSPHSILTEHSIHSALLAFLFRTGVVGLFLYVLFVFALFKDLIKLVCHNQFQSFRNKIHASIIFLCIYILSSFVSYVFWADLLLTLFIVFVGLLLRDHTYYSTRKSHST